MDLKERAKNLEPILRIGKNGLTSNVHNEVEKLLKKRKLIKIKILNNCPILDKDEVISQVLKESKAELIQTVGNTFSIYREKKKSP